MTRMIDQLLDLTRSRSDTGLRVTPAPLGLGTLARSIADELSLANPDRAVNLEVRGDAQGEWDADRLGQVLSNLMGNAIEHGAPAEAVRVCIDGRDPESVVIETHNAGSIGEEHLASLFDPFRRASTEASSSSGLGLGLYITKVIAQAHGGNVSVASGPEGTTFRVELPRTARSPRRT